MMQPIVTRTARVWLDDDDIVNLQPIARHEQNLEDAKENVAAVTHVCGGTPKPLLIHFEAAAPQTAECRAYYLSKPATSAVLAVAIVTNSLLGRIVGNLMIGMHTSGSPVRLFVSYDNALTWLREHQPQRLGRVAAGRR